MEIIIVLQGGPIAIWDKYKTEHELCIYRMGGTAGGGIVSSGTTNSGSTNSELINGGTTYNNEIVAKADEIHKYMEANNYTYCASNNGDECNPKWPDSGHVANGQAKRTFEGSKTVKKTACAFYVSWVLQETGIMGSNQISTSVGGIMAFLQTCGWTKITSVDELQPGDILFYRKDGSLYHIDIYAGNNTRYTAGAGNVIRTSSPCATDWTNFSCAYRRP